MNLTDGRLAPAAGTDGLVARTPGAVLFVAARHPADDVAELLGTFTGVDDATPGRSLARALAALVGADSDTSLPGFAVVAATPSGTYVKVYGAVEVQLQGPDRAETISGVGSFTGVDREVTGGYHTVVAHRAGEPAPAPAFDVDLTGGSAPAGGFALTLMASPTDTPVVDVPPAMTGTAPAEAPAAGPAGSEAPPGEPLERATEAWSAEDLAAATAVGAAASAPAPPLDAPAMDEPTTHEPEAGLDGSPDLDALPVVEPATTAGPVQSFDDLPIAEEDPGPAGGEPAAEAEPEAEPGPLPVAEEPPSAPAAAPAEFTSFLLGALDNDDVDERDALPVEPEPGEVRQADAGDTAEVLVQGVVCSRGHFNDPRSRFCSSCGISMVQNTQVLTNGPRPPLGVMVFEDGATFSLFTDYVVGRQPEVSELVQQGLANPLPVDDPERSISRAHAELRLVDWDVHLVNLSGTNGSFVWDEPGQQWIPIPEGQSVVLTPGMRVALGRRSAVFESSLVR